MRCPRRSRRDAVRGNRTGLCLRAGWGVVIGSLLMAALARPASAHVAVTPDRADAGSTPVLEFRVPNERPVTTNAVRIVIPDTAPVAIARPLATPGWTTAVATEPVAPPLVIDGREVTEVVRSVTWAGGAIAVGGAETFSVELGPLPGPGPIAFRAVQTYADGEIVRWNQPVEPGGNEPERPAPTLTVDPDPTPPPVTPTSTASPAASTEPSAPTTRPVPPANGASDSATIALAAAAVIGVGILVFVSLLRRRRRGTPSDAR